MKRRESCVPSLPFKMPPRRSGVEVLAAVICLQFVVSSLGSMFCPSKMRHRFAVYENMTIEAAPLTRTVTESAMYCVMACSANPVCSSINAIAGEAGRTTCETFDVTTRAGYTLKRTKNAAYHEVKQDFQDCGEARRNGIVTSGVTTVKPGCGASMSVYCDAETDRGGWIVLQRRKDGSVNFNRDWADYKKGFGDLRGEFWLGLDKMHELMKSRLYTLRFDLWDGEEHKFAEFSNASIASEQENYTLDFISYSGGNAGDSLTEHHKGSPFSTTDRDNDENMSKSCSQAYGGGGWWYGACHVANLNGLYFRIPENIASTSLLSWLSFHGYHSGLSAVEMKIKIKQ